MTVAFFDTKPYDQTYFQSDDQVDFHFYNCRLTAETASLVKGAEAVCVFVNDEIDDPCLEQLANYGIRHLALRCAGFNNVDLEAAQRRKIRVTRVPAYSPHAIAEHTVALLLTLNRQIHRAYQRVREHNFSLAGLVGFDLHRKTVGIIGTGKIGRITAEIFQGFGCHVIVQDLFPDLEWSRERGISFVSLNQLLQQADIISLHLPLTPETFHLIDETAFQQMKPGAFLINTGRGKLIDTTALLTTLKKQHLGGVALDVYEEEEGVFFEDLSNSILQDDELTRLLTFPNVLVTSHQAFLTHEALTQIASITRENLQQYPNFLEGTELMQTEHS